MSMGKGVRRTGRELALKVIYSLGEHDRPVDTVLAEFWANFRFQDDVLGEPLEERGEPVPYEVRRFAEGLVGGVSTHLEEIDAVIRESSTNWALDRMARVDLALLRLGTYELMYSHDVPVSVAINEAIEIGKRFGTKDTPSFINGILDRISRTRPRSTS